MSIGVNLEVSDTKSDRFSPRGQFNLSGFSTPFKKNCIGLLIYINSDILSKTVKFPDSPSNIQVILVEVNLKKQKRLVVAIYTSPSQRKNYVINELIEILDKSGDPMKTL